MENSWVFALPKQGPKRELGVLGPLGMAGFPTVRGCWGLGWPCKQPLVQNYILKECKPQGSGCVILLFPCAVDPLVTWGFTEAVYSLALHVS